MSRPSALLGSISSSTAAWSACASCSRSSTVPRASRPTTTGRTCRSRPRGSNSRTCISPIASMRRCCAACRFVAEPGKLTALVGPSGGGKSTVFNLILRFYETERGMIVIDGQDITKVSRRSLRQHIAYVGQDVFLFRGTIRENIAFGKPDASEDEIVAAAKARLCARFHHVIPARLRHAGRRTRPAAVRRPAPARGHRTRADQERADHPARRGDRRARFGIRIAGARGDGASLPGPHHAGHRASAAHGLACRPHLCGGGRPRGRVRPPRRIAAQERPLCLVLPAAAQGSGGGARSSPLRHRKPAR